MSYRHQLRDYFRPILLWMKVLGVNLVEDDHVSNHIYAVFTFGFSLVSNIASITLMFLGSSYPEASSIDSNTYNQTLIIDNFSFITMAIGGHLMLLCHTRRRWKNLWNTLVETESEIMNAIFLRRTRQFIILISLLFIPVFSYR